MGSLRAESVFFCSVTLPKTAYTLYQSLNRTLYIKWHELPTLLQSTL